MYVRLYVPDLARLIWLGALTRCWGKVFFPMHCNLSLCYIPLPEISNVLNTMRVYSRSGWPAIFWTTNSSQVLLLVAKYWKFYGKNTIFPEHPVHIDCGMLGNWINHPSCDPYFYGPLSPGPRRSLSFTFINVLTKKESNKK